jgi:PRTRC genetic system protein C
MSTEVLKREFHFKEEVLTDPDPAMSVPEVLDFYSGKYPELTSGVVQEPEIDEGKLIYNIDFVMGEKG